MILPRWHLVEIEDLPWCPGWLRDRATRVLVRGLNWIGWPGAVARVWGPWLERLGWPAVVDCCSGSAGPWGELLQRLPVKVRFTDRYPNPGAWKELEERFPGRAEGCVTPLDARCLPPDCQGVWSFFNSFHHLSRAEARQVVAEAVHRQQPLAVFEAVDRHWTRLLVTPLMAVFALLTGEFHPLVWALLLFDGWVSCFRCYSREDWQAMLAEADPEGKVRWEFGRFRMGWLPVTGSYLLACLPQQENR